MKPFIGNLVKAPKNILIIRYFLDKHKIYWVKEVQRGMKMEMDKHEIIEILNYSFGRSFALTKYNQISIFDIVWYPLNHNLLCDKEIYSTVTSKDIELDKDVA